MLHLAVECGINRPETRRAAAAAARYDQLTVRCRATVRIAAVDEWP
nr:hypothetical protein [Streptomyces antibioticus]